MDYLNIFENYKETSLYGRYIHNEHIYPILTKHSNLCKETILKEIGKSVNNLPIYSYQIGSGPTRLFFWSQMHGNESTTTKAVFDFFNFLNSNTPFSQELKKQFTFLFIPILNPDGAKNYTRVNANEVDLNRDSQNLTQPESKLLQEIYHQFSPDYCFNLHDQRTIFGAGKSGSPATVSFLAPSYNEACEINETRQQAIRVIVAINEVLQKFIPGKVGRFDDAFNINCIGDTFQAKGTPTILFEAGHFPDDYQREETRKYIFISLLSACKHLAENDIVVNEINKYINIPQNNIVFYDFMYKNSKINYDGIEIITNFAAQYKEELVKDKIEFKAYISQIGDLDGFYGHQVFDAKGKLFQDEKGNFPKIDGSANFNFDNEIFFENGSIVESDISENK